MNKQAIVEVSQLKKEYQDGRSWIPVLKSIDFSIKPGDSIAIVGPSGSGKSTFLHLLGGLDTLTSGELRVQGKSWQKLSEHQRCQLRNQTFGFVYQFHHLLPEFSALENVAMPLLLAHDTVSSALKCAEEVLVEVGLGHRLQHRPAQLSGGERQRVAIARALVHQPQCVFADEPTGNLDHATATHVFDLMLDMNKKRGTALVVVTHDQALASRMDVVIALQDGELRII